MRKLVIAVCMALAGLAVAAPASAQLSFGFSSGGVHLGINIPVYPNLVAIPGYPVYYAPNLNQNYFFYDGYYWLFYEDNWYESQWYNGPWTLVPPDYVPLYVLRVPVRYYHHRPAYFRGWALNEPPRWEQHYGYAWAEKHRDWNRWDRHYVPQRAPLPTYQRQYSGNRYPNAERQRVEHDRNYRYQPRDEAVRQYREQRPAPQQGRRDEHRGPAPQAPQAREQQHRDSRPAPGPGSGPGGSPTQRDAERWGSGG